MTRQNRKIKEFDGKAAALLAAGRLSDEEVERIASGPHLMASVWARIAAEKTANDARPVAETARPFIFGWRTAFAAVAVLMVVAAGTVVFLRGTSQTPEVASVPEQRFEGRPAIADFPSASQSDDFFSAATPKQSRPHIEQAALRPGPRRAVRQVREARETSLPAPPPLEFYTLPSAQDAAEAVKDARIVTVELPRASLVALGANITLEGDKQLVKADLLVGPDGVPRAIRLAD